MAAVVLALLELPTWRRRLERLTGHSFSATFVARTLVLSFLHDVGKAGLGFQAKAWTDAQQAVWRKDNNCGLDQQGHTRSVAPLLGFTPEFARHRAALGVERIRLWGGESANGQQAIIDLWLAAISHHGEPIALDDDMQRRAAAPHPTWSATSDHYSPLEALRELQQTAKQVWPTAFDPAEQTTAPTQAFIHAFAGLVSLADWIGSDIRHFPFDLGGSQDARRWPHSVDAARSALRAMRIDVEDIRTDLCQRSPGFKSVFEFDPTAVQRACADLPAVSPVVLEAETGSGKTEAALWRFKTLFEAGEVDALCFLLPTRVAATGISARLEEFVRRLFPDESLRPNTVLAVPGYLRANATEGQWLAPFTVQWPDRDVGDPLFWAAENSKRYFAATVAAATIDQFLLSTLQTKHAHLRGSVLLRSLVVVDEVHASDPYMRALLVKALRRHQAAGGHALLLSATLTSDLRDELLRTASAPKAIGKGLGAQRLAPAPPCTPQENDYPCLRAPGVARTFGPILQHKRIQHSLQPWIRDPHAVARCAVAAVQAGGRVLVLRNTVRQAIATQQAIEALLGADHPALFRCQAVAALHHGRYALPDRRALDARVSALFGKDAAKRRHAVLLCATQTVEISVDCDADFMITDLAPMDVLLQRLGRLHRHATRLGFRPTGHGEPRCVVLVPPDGDLSGLLSGGAGGMGIGKRSAYPDLLALQATLNALNDTQRYPVLDIPSDNRALVERCCGRPALQQLSDELGGDWPAHFQSLLGLASAQGAAALYQCVDWAQPWRNAVPGELSTEAKTRLGLDSIEVDLPAGTRSPFGHALERLNVPAWMLPALPEHENLGAPAVERLREDGEGLHFSIHGQAFSYTRWGLALTERAS